MVLVSQLSSFPRPLGTDVPSTCEVPHFAPVRVRGGRYQVRRLVRHRRRALAVGLAVTAVALVAAGPRERDTGARGRAVVDAVRERPVEMVAAPVRIADGATVRLLRAGDRVDVVAAEQGAVGPGDARVVARGARVTKVPASPDSVSEGGALVVLSVPRRTATLLAGAGATSRLAVTLC
ncbi:hypothetical protein [Streptomyces phaeochromogenes]|uniref:hypothetical protein n=1 Tax=Streptomyces phaeochromogenes TaxID=1923 RepID=UPI002DDC27FD|nr:hypothetical protein [Streptomyces phaeochromogenes]WRZ30120.1 hypothetical protein OG931_21415 [Streptomyces phaeochromogenes]